MTNKKQLSEFWIWFSSVANSLAYDVKNLSLLEELDTRIRGLDSELSWEIGPGSCEPWQLVISPNLDRDLRQKTREIIANAPSVSGWEFHSVRGSKDWDYKLVMERPEGEPPVQLDASDWKFVILRYPDGSQEILLEGKDLPPLNDEERWQATAITLESILGEEVLLEKINDFALLDEVEPRFAEKRRPIQQLRDAVFAV